MSFLDIALSNLSVFELLVGPPPLAMKARMPPAKRTSTSKFGSWRQKDPKRVFRSWLPAMPRVAKTCSPPERMKIFSLLSCLGTEIIGGLVIQLLLRHRHEAVLIGPSCGRVLEHALSAQESWPGLPLPNQHQAPQGAPTPFKSFQYRRVNTDI